MAFVLQVLLALVVSVSSLGEQTPTGDSVAFARLPDTLEFRNLNAAAWALRRTLSMIV